MVTMNMKEVKDTIKESVKLYLEKDKNGRYVLPQNKQRPLFLMGKPGIGKTEIVEQAAKECGIGFVSYSLTHHTRQSAVGLPSIVTGSCNGKSYEATEYTMPEIVESVYRCITDGQKEGILFIDEVNCVSETMRAVMLQFLQNKCFGTHKIPAGWIIVAAGNPAKYNRSAESLDSVTRDRVRFIHADADIDTWLEYAEEKNLHHIVISFVRNNRESFYLFAQSVKAVVTPRAWEDLSNTLKGYERFGFQVTLPLIAQFIQYADTASAFYNYYELYSRLLGNGEIEALFAKGEYRPAAELLKKVDFQSRWAVICIILKRLEDDSEEIAQAARNSRSRGMRTDHMEGLTKWHHMLENCLLCVSEGCGNGPETEYVLSGLCRNCSTGYLLALKENPCYDRLYREINGHGTDRKKLKREIQKKMAGVE